MDERVDLNEFQARLAQRLKDREEGAAAPSLLGFVAGGRHWLTPLDQVGEVITVSRLARAPWTQPWFLGVAGVRGTLYGCTDLAAFLGIAPVETADELRLLLVNPRLGGHVAFRIERALGLRNRSDMTEITPTGAEPAWISANYLDAEGTEWSEIALDNVMARPEFLGVLARRA